MSRNLKVAIIARGLTRGGVTRFIMNLLKEFSKNDDFDFFLFTDEPELALDNIESIYVKKANLLKWDYFELKKYLSSFNLDSVVYTKNIIPFTHKPLSFRKYNIVHDLAYFDKNLNEYKLKDTVYMKTFMKYSFEISDGIFSVSNSTKKDIRNRFNIPNDKIHVINEGVDDVFKRVDSKNILGNVISKFNLSLPFLFYCGSLSPRKNLLRTLVAFNKLKDVIPHHIYLAGGQSWKDRDVLTYIEKNLKDRVHGLGYVSDDDLACLYSLADLYLFPSLYEGFGLPILEAQACGCPVLTSGLTSCPEVAGDGAVIVNATSISDIQSGILHALQNSDQLSRLGYENLKRYGWSLTAKKILDVLGS